MMDITPNTIYQDYLGKVLCNLFYVDIRQLKYQVDKVSHLSIQHQLLLINVGHIFHYESSQTTEAKHKLEGGGKRVKTKFRVLYYKLNGKGYERSMPPPICSFQ